MNKVIIVGNLGKDPEVITTKGGPLCKFSIATSEVWKDKQGEKQEKTEWHNILVFGMQAEHCGKYLAKGKKALVEGKIQTSSYEDKDGVKRYSTDIIAQKVEFLGGGSATNSAPKTEPMDFGKEPDFSKDAEIPF